MPRLHSPKNLNGPTGTSHQPEYRQCLQQKSYSDRLHIVHPDISHADPDVVIQGKEGHECEDLEPLLCIQARPAFVAEVGRTEEKYQQNYREHRHDDRGNTLSEPVSQAIVLADDQALGSDIIVGDL